MDHELAAAQTDPRAACHLLWILQRCFCFDSACCVPLPLSSDPKSVCFQMEAMTVQFSEDLDLTSKKQSSPERQLHASGISALLPSLLP